jgi:hypothetical protein
MGISVLLIPYFVVPIISAFPFAHHQVIHMQSYKYHIAVEPLHLKNFK